jgi:hypothetical protein
MNKLKFRFLLPTCILLIPPNFQVLSQNQSLYRFIINKKEQRAKFALVTLVKEVLHNGEYKVDFNLSSMLGLQPGINNFFLAEIYLSQLKIYLLQTGYTKCI